MMSIPALLRRTSTRPQPSSVFATIRSTSALLEVSTLRAIAFRPSAAISLATCSTCGSVRLTATTSAPCRARPSASVLPMPRPAPVTMATLPPRSKSLPMDLLLVMSPTDGCGGHAGPRAPAQLADIDGHHDQAQPDRDLPEGGEPRLIDHRHHVLREARALQDRHEDRRPPERAARRARPADDHRHPRVEGDLGRELVGHDIGDRKSTRLNSSHSQISYAV